MTQKWVIDLTRAWAGTEGDVLAAVVDQNRLSPGTFKVICLLRQLPAVQRGAPTTPAADVANVPNFTNAVGVENFVAQQVEQILARGETVKILSFHANVKERVLYMNTQYPGRIHFEPLNRYSQGGLPGEPLRWDETFMPEEEAVDAVISALADAPSPMHKTSLRPRLAARDPRFDKGYSEFTSKAGFVSVLLSLARKRGFVEVIGEEPGQLIALTATGRAALPEGTATGSRQVGGRGGRVGLSRTPSGGSPAHGSRIRKSDQFIDILRHEGNFGPFQEVRTAVYQEMEKQVTEHPGEFSVHDLICKAASVTRDTRSNELLHDPEKPFPWSNVIDFIVRLVNRRAVLISDGNLVRHTWTEMAKEVDALDDDWQLKLDGELVLFLLENGTPVSVHDIGDLAGALYNSHNPESRRRVIEVVRLLLEENRVIDQDSDLKLPA
ncbi:hypothetical protein [Streptomyces sp. NPDC001816]|uniref:hypothetical protein n=1 Tax=Streptomyces sp. NPDC001816 TaxID=3364612 RepID=UPI0036CC33D0